MTTQPGQLCTYGPPAERQHHWLLRFDDPDRGDCHFDNEQDAMEFFARAEGNWTCTLFVTATLEGSPMKPERTAEELIDDRPPSREHPRPWRVEPDPDDPKRCWGIFDANDDLVVVTDGGIYPPNRRVAEMIVYAVNKAYPP